MKVRIAQLIVTQDLKTNTDKILNVINQSNKGDWVVFPEGMLSGYFPANEEFTNKLNWTKIESSLNKIKAAVKHKSISCIVSTALFKNNRWYNSSIFIGTTSKDFVYDKVNLATLDRKFFTAGNNLDVFESDSINFGIQMCRDDAFPEQWLTLKRKSAQVIFHVNNAIKQKDLVRKSLLVARAFENQFFVVSVNNAAEPQSLPSLAISPLGKVIFESKPQVESVTVVELDLSEVKTDYLLQKRNDLIDIMYKG